MAVFGIFCLSGGSADRILDRPFGRLGRLAADCIPVGQAIFCRILENNYLSAGSVEKIFEKKPDFSQKSICIWRKIGYNR